MTQYVYIKSVLKRSYLTSPLILSMQAIVTTPNRDTGIYLDPRSHTMKKTLCVHVPGKEGMIHTVGGSDSILLFLYSHIQTGSHTTG